MQLYGTQRKGIEMLVNLINIAYCAMKLLPYQEEAFSKYRKESVQDFRFALQRKDPQEVFYATFVKKSENIIKSSALMRNLEISCPMKQSTIYNSCKVVLCSLRYCK